MTAPITPPLKLVQQWIKECNNPEKPHWQEYEQDIANQSAQWGWDQRGAATEAELQKAADQELEACCEWMRERGLPPEYWRDLRIARRPKPPSLKKQALEALNQADEGLNESAWQQRSDTIRQALEQLND